VREDILRVKYEIYFALDLKRIKIKHGKRALTEYQI